VRSFFYITAPTELSAAKSAALLVRIREFVTSEEIAEIAKGNPVTNRYFGEQKTAVEITVTSDSLMGRPLGELAEAIAHKIHKRTKGVIWWNPPPEAVMAPKPEPQPDAQPSCTYRSHSPGKVGIIEIMLEQPNTPMSWRNIATHTPLNRQSIQQLLRLLIAEEMVRTCGTEQGSGKGRGATIYRLTDFGLHTSTDYIKKAQSALKPTPPPIDTANTAPGFAFIKGGQADVLRFMLESPDQPVTLQMVMDHFGMARSTARLHITTLIRAGIVGEVEEQAPTNTRAKRYEVTERARQADASSRAHAEDEGNLHYIATLTSEKSAIRATFAWRMLKLSNSPDVIVRMKTQTHYHVSFTGHDPVDRAEFIRLLGEVSVSPGVEVQAVSEPAE